MKIFCVLSIFSFFFYSCRNQTIDKVSLPAGAIPMDYSSYIVIPAIVDDSIKGDFILDIGTEYFHIDSFFYYRNKFSYKNFQNVKLWGIGNSRLPAKMIKDSVNLILNNKFYNPSFVFIHDIKHIAGDYADGLLGLKCLSINVFEINYQKEFVKFYESIDSVDVTGYTEIPLVSINNQHGIACELKINDNLKIKGSFIIDTGSPFSTLTSAVANKFDLNERIEPKVSIFLKNAGIGGSSNVFGFIADSLYVSDFKLFNVNLSYSTDTFGILSSDVFSGIIGNDVLDRFDNIFDFKNKKLYLKPNDKYKEPYEFDRLGFSFVDRIETLGVWVVESLTKGSPADNNGLQIDDKIISLNYIPVGKLSYKNVDYYFKTIDEVKMGVNRDGNFIEIKFMLKPLLEKGNN